VLYNLHRARDGMRRLNRAVLVEGYMDVIGAYTAGVKEVVASCGTALTPAQVRSMRRHADTVVVNFDPDSAGANAADRAIQLLLDEGLHVRVLTLDGGLDPDEYVKQNGAEAYRARLDAAGGYFHWLADRTRSRFDTRTAEGRMDAFKTLIPTVQKIGDKLERAAVANDLASYLGVEPGLVLDQLKRTAADRRAPQVPGEIRPQPGPGIPANERLLLSALLASERGRAEILPQLTGPMLEGWSTREIFEALRQTEASEGGGFSALEARLSQPAQALLHQLLAADDMNEDSGLDQARACLRQLESGLRKQQLNDLRARAKEAEREGRVEEALRWAAELSRLQREEAGAGR
jgi:DNA primase